MFPKAIAIAAVLIAISVPAMAQSRVCERLHRDYEDADGPKAWAVGSGGCGYSSARTASSPSDARRRAFNSCSEYAQDCRVTEEQYR